MPDTLWIEWGPAVAAGVVDQGESLRGVSIPMASESDDGFESLMASRLREAVASTEGVLPQRAVVVLPRESVVIRRLDLPAVADEEMPDLVAMQASLRSSVPIERLAFDFVPQNLTSGEHVAPASRVMTLVSCDIDRIEQLKRIFAAAGIPLFCVSISSYAIATAVRRIDRQTATEETSDRLRAQAVILQSGERVEITVFTDSDVLLAHALELPQGTTAEHVRPLISEISRSLVALQHDNPGINLSRILLLSEGSLDTVVRDALTTKYGDICVAGSSKTWADCLLPNWPAGAPFALVGAIVFSEQKSESAGSTGFGATLQSLKEIRSARDIVERLQLQQWKEKEHWQAVGEKLRPHAENREKWKGLAQSGWRKFQGEGDRIRVGNAGPDGVDLLNPRRAIPRPDMRVRYGAVAGVVTALLGIIGWWWVSGTVAAREEEIVKMQAAESLIKQLVERGKPTLETASALEVWKRNDPDIAALLSHVTRHLPSTERAYFVDWKYSPEKSEQGQASVKASGRARTRDDVDRLYDNLALNGCRVIPHPYGAGKDPDYPVEFSLDLEIHAIRPTK